MTYTTFLKTLSFAWIMLLTSCTSFVEHQTQQAHAAKPFVKSLSISSMAETNKNMPIALDLVIVGHPALATKINTMSANQFFKEKRQLKQDHPRHIKVQSFEIIPGHTIPEFPILYPRKDVSAAFIFARFQNNFPNRWRLLPADTVRIYIREQHLEIMSEDDNTPVDKTKMPVPKPATPIESTLILSN